MALIPPPRKTYQDLVLHGETAVPGARDCWQRWEILRPYLPSCGCVLDVGSNMGWFGWQITRPAPQCLVASVEPDESSAVLQRAMLRSHQSERICLLTARADARLARCFVEARQRFDAVLCLSVLHWLPEHREFLSLLGAISRRFLIEQPDPRESGAGFERIRGEIGPIGAYLEELFPLRPRQRLAQLASHRECPYPREIWLVDEPPGEPARPARGLEVSALLALAPSWPPRDWWLQQARRLDSSEQPTGDLVLTVEGLRGGPVSRRLRRRLARLPQERLLTSTDWCYRRLRRLGGKILRGLRLKRRLV